MTQQTDLLVDLMTAVNRQMHEHVRPVWEARDVPATQLMVMHQIAREEGITVSEVARRLGLAKSHVSKTADELATAGYVEKRPDPHDGRVLRLHQTDSGRHHFGVMHRQIRERIAAVVSVLPPEKAEGLIEGLRLLSVALETAKEQERSLR